MEATLSPVACYDQVLGALTDSSHFSSREVHADVADGYVRLHGTVGTFYQKQMAQELVRRVDGVEKIENQLEVNWR
ncbi:MAG: BON domain-containing protein [Pirellulales bacterium]|nr:BON domain-containing protein [Pirellulales bacterium]